MVSCCRTRSVRRSHESDYLDLCVRSQPLSRGSWPLRPSHTSYSGGTSRDTTVETELMGRPRSLFRSRPELVECKIQHIGAHRAVLFAFVIRGM
ncbi:MAG: hypothetical protein J07HR59_01374 [Halorubrum sp. J07HR59]|nr:MAG: hypothetical protein J07HR59_01374 [Halorubrum sp. J07HR59]